MDSQNQYLLHTAYNPQSSNSSENPLGPGQPYPSEVPNDGEDISRDYGPLIHDSTTLFSDFPSQPPPLSLADTVNYISPGPTSIYFPSNTTYMQGPENDQQIYATDLSPYLFDIKAHYGNPRFFPR